MVVVGERPEQGLLPSLNRVGMRMLQGKFCSITNNMTYACVKIDPLMERDVIAHVSKVSPVKLSMNMWQRKEIEQYCPKLNDIETDQGYSCSVKLVTLVKESFKKGMFYLSRVVARLRRKLGVSYKDSTPHYWDHDYMEAANTELFQDALEVCKQLGVVKEDLTVEEVPKSSVGELLLIGMFFGDRVW